MILFIHYFINIKTQIMAHTVVGFFDDAEDARDAVEDLVDAGIDRTNIDMSNSESMRSGESSTMSTSGEHKGNAISNFFSSLFGSDSDDAKKYSRVGSEANCIVTVHAQTESEAENAADILDDNGAFDVDERAANYNLSGTAGRADVTAGNAYNRTGDDSGSIERIEEELEVGKRTVETGGVRLRSRIVERPVEEQVRLREEHVEIERNPVNRRASADDLRNFEEKEIEITERSEVPVVNKEARVVEEIKVNKEVTEREEVIRDNVRHTEVDIDDLRSKDQTGRRTDPLTD